MDEQAKLTMGIGNGGGNLFVEGNYDSITALQQKLFELEEFRKKADQRYKLSFSEALDRVKNGANISRASWDKETFIFLVPGSNFTVNRPPLDEIFREGTKINYSPHIDIYKDRKVGVWIPTQEDLLADDYQVVYRT